MNKQSLVGRRINHLVVIEKVKSVWKFGKTTSIWKCLCDCGKYVEYRTNQLYRKRLKFRSCGCKEELRHKREYADTFADAQMISKKRLYRKHINSAKERNLVWEIDFDQFISLIEGNCVYCLIPPSSSFNTYKHKNGEYLLKYNKERCDAAEIMVNGIDRRDSRQGYTIQNSISCCSKCNYAKRDYPYEEFISWLRKIAKVWS